MRVRRTFPHASLQVEGVVLAPPVEGNNVSDMTVGRLEVKTHLNHSISVLRLNDSKR
jgi:hypothetical protein